MRRRERGAAGQAEQADQKLPGRLPKLFFAVFFCGLLLMSGVHMGIVFLLAQLPLHAGVKAAIPILYWIVVSLLVTMFVRRMMRKTYDAPLQQLARATRLVAAGDFSVYVPTVHTPDKMDYLDEMILDFNKMTEELGSIETLKTDFISNVSHEMKTPIAAIRSDAQLLRRAAEAAKGQGQMRTGGAAKPAVGGATAGRAGTAAATGFAPAAATAPAAEAEGQDLPAVTAQYAQHIMDTADQMAGLITNILRLNKLENQRIAPEWTRFDLCEQLCDCIFGFDARLEEKQLELNADLPDRAFLEADPNLLSLVWNNLLSNAIKFTEPGGAIDISVQEAAGQVAVTVRDSGCGMDDTTRRHIFDQFFQGDTSHAAEGNGLGLALAARVVELLNGTISVESKMGEGSAFTVTLPKERAAQSDAAADA